MWRCCSVFKTHKFFLFRLNITKTVTFCANSGNHTGIKALLDFTKALLSRNLCANIINTNSVPPDSRPESSSNSLRFYHVVQLWSEKIRFCRFPSDYTTMKWSDLAHKKWHLLVLILPLKVCGFQWNQLMSYYDNVQAIHVVSVENAELFVWSEILMVLLKYKAAVFMWVVK